MPHIHNGPGQHDHTVSAFIIKSDGSNIPGLLLHRHKKYGKLMQIGGHVELNETPWQALVHEIKEESGYLLSQLRVLQPKVRMNKLSESDLHFLPLVYSTHEINDEHNHTDSSYAFIADSDPQGEPVAGESTDIRFYSRREIIELSNYEIVENIREIGLFILDNYRTSWDAVKLT